MAGLLEKERKRGEGGIEDQAVRGVNDKSRQRGGRGSKKEEGRRRKGRGQVDEQREGQQFSGKTQCPQTASTLRADVLRQIGVR
jgi:hypothetical protein